MLLDSEKEIELEMISLDKIRPNAWNPNEMGMFELNKLAEDMADIGFLQPILVVPAEDGTYRIIDGEHRYEVAKLCDYTEIPAIVVKKDAIVSDEDRQKFQTVRMNRLRGKLNRRKLDALIEDLLQRHSATEVAEGLVFEDDSYIQELVAKARESLPTEELKKEFDKVKDDVRTIDDLTVLLNRLYLKYGETLDYGYMVFDFGGKDHLWVRLGTKADFLLIKDKADMVREAGYSFPSAVVALFKTLDSAFLEKRSAELETVYDDDESL